MPVGPLRFRRRRRRLYRELRAMVMVFLLGLVLMGAACALVATLAVYLLPPLT